MNSPNNSTRQSDCGCCSSWSRVSKYKVALKQLYFLYFLGARSLNQYIFIRFVQLVDSSLEVLAHPLIEFILIIEVERKCFDDTIFCRQRETTGFPRPVFTPHNRFILYLPWNQSNSFRIPPFGATSYCLVIWIWMVLYPQMFDNLFIFTIFFY